MDSGIRILLGVCIVIAAFFAGRMTSNVGTTDPRDSSHLSPQGDADSSEQTAAPARDGTPAPTAGTSDESSTLVGDQSPHVEGVQAPNLISPNEVTSRACLAQVSRFDLWEWNVARNAKLEQFREKDAQFGSRTKVAETDWNRFLALGNLSGSIRFVFPTEKPTEIEIRLGEQTDQFRMFTTIRPRDATADNPTQTIRNSWTIRNGNGVGLARDGSRFYVVVPNYVEEPNWIDYSSFSIPIPFDWNGRSEISSEVFGLTEDFRWVTVGSATLRKR